MVRLLFKVVDLVHAKMCKFDLQIDFIKADASTAFEATPQITALGGDDQVAVDFTAAADPVGALISNYQYSLDEGWSWLALNPAITGSPATISGLTNGVKYSIELRAVNSIGPRAISQSAKATPIAMPNAPTNLSATTNAL